MYPVTNLRLFGHEAQSESQYPVSFVTPVPLISITPSPEDFLIYLTTLSAASQCETLGFCMNLLRTWTLKQILGLVIVKYNNLPISLWYAVISSNSASSDPPMC